MTTFNLKELLHQMNAGYTPQQIQDFQNADINDIYSARQYGVTPTEARQRQALEAQQRAEERLGLIKPMEDYAAQFAAQNGIVGYNSPKEVTQMSQQERFENFLNQKIPDPQMQRDAKELSYNLLAYRYGQDFANHIQQQRQQAMGDVITASQYTSQYTYAQALVLFILLGGLWCYLLFKSKRNKEL
ncbi:MAG: hypothetical protein Q4E77_09465 [Conchiformibius sp.]|nr:hypothetical protein [Conchiformibius sp.]